MFRQVSLQIDQVIVGRFLFPYSTLLDEIAKIVMMLVGQFLSETDTVG